MSDYDGNAFDPEDSADTPPSDPNGSSTPRINSSSEWDSDEALSFLKMEQDVHNDESTEILTKRLLEEAAPIAAMSIINLARHSGNDNTRLNASKYIIDTLLTEQSTGGKQAWEDILAETVETAQKYANDSAS